MNDQSQTEMAWDDISSLVGGESIAEQQREKVTDMVLEQETAKLQREQREQAELKRLHRERMDAHKEAFKSLVADQEALNRKYHALRLEMDTITANKVVLEQNAKSISNLKGRIRTLKLQRTKEIGGHFKLLKMRKDEKEKLQNDQMKLQRTNEQRTNESERNTKCREHENGKHEEDDHSVCSLYFCSTMKLSII